MQWEDADCDESNLRLPLWMVFVLHIINGVETLMNIIGVEKKLCNTPILCGFFIVEFTVLVYMQIAYF